MMILAAHTRASWQDLMQSPQSLRFLLRITSLYLLAHATFATAGVDEALTLRLQQLAPHEEVSVIVTMKGAERPEAYQVQDRRDRDGRLVKALKVRAKVSQRPIKRYLNLKHAKNLKNFWIINGLAATVRADQVEALAAQPNVKSVRYDEVVTLEAPLAATGDGPPEWNLNAVGIPDLWAAGQKGAGVVIATMDTGFDMNHPDIADKWRGGNNSWFDPHGQHPNPFDSAGHGTSVMGLLVGGNASGTNIGVAPDAKFIATKIFNDANQSTFSTIHSAFQWLLDPDNDPDTQDAPDVVNASWGLPGTNNKCNIEFDTDIRMLQAAGIAVVFAGGNDGPAPATGVSPSSSAGVISSGAVNSTLDPARFSSRGPSPCGGGSFPTLVAPGESIYTSDITSGDSNAYTIVSGTSFATPHVAGVLALLTGRYPSLLVSDLFTALKDSARDLGTPGADNVTGLGLLDAVAAMQLLDARPAGNTPLVTSLPPTVAMVGVPYEYTVAGEDADGDSLSFSLDASPDGMSVDATGKIVWVPGSNFAGKHLVTVRVTDATGLFSTQPYVVEVANVNDAPVAKDDNYEIEQATSLRVIGDGILNNDRDPNSDQLVVVNFGTASTGSLRGNNDGTFEYNPPSPSFFGIVTFTYRVSDGTFTSAEATVTINVLENEATPLDVLDTYPVNIVNSPPTYPSLFADDQEAFEKVDDRNDVASDEEDDKSKPDDGDSSAPTFTSTPTLEAMQGEHYSYQVEASAEDGSELDYSLDTAPQGMTIDEYGEISWTPTNAQTGERLVVVRISDTDNQFATQSYTLVVENVNDAPVATDDKYNLIHTSRYSIAAPGVLRNDTDVDQTPLSAVSYSRASKGKLIGESDGSFSYQPPSRSFTGKVTFTYSASDGELSSDEATVTVNILANRAPLPRGDAVTVTARKQGVRYTPRPIKVLANDRDPDRRYDPNNTIDTTTLEIVTPPNKQGTLKVTKNGIVNYTPAIGFRGIETFYYRVSDTRKASSKKVIVRINVK